MTFEAVFNTDTFGVLVLDATAHILMVNQAFSTMTGFDRAVLVGMPMVAAITGVDTPIDEGSSLSIMARRLHRGDGTFCWVTIDERRLSHPVGAAHSIVIVQDVSMLNDSIQQLARQARIDEAVTGLMNRSAFTATLQREIDRCEREHTSLALVWLDLDRFKEVNDQHGHSVGDDVLRVTAERLQEVVRSQESVGRLGGDEFGIIVSGFDRIEDLEPLFERILASLRRTISSHDMVDNVTASLGVASYPADGIGVTQLLRASDAAMYGVKSAGGNGFGYYTDSMNTAAEQRRTMRHAFATALEEHQFELYYQPILTAATGTEAWGLEALIRWHRDGEVVSAGTFIGFIEESGQIREIGPLMFAMLRDDVAALRTAGHVELPVCFNMSVHQLDDPAFGRQLHSWPTSAGLEGLIVEVTESVFLPDNERAMDALKTLVEMGAEISIDDFGSGFSNLLQLSALSPAYVKLDRSMLTVAAEPSRGVALLTCAVDLAKALGARVVVEGIEAEAQLLLARSLRADFVQGFHLARPMPRDTLLQWLVDPAVRAAQRD
jgi:two-component system CheB/CheR fusion protein